MKEKNGRGKDINLIFFLKNKIHKIYQILKFDFCQINRINELIIFI